MLYASTYISKFLEIFTLNASWPRQWCGNSRFPLQSSAKRRVSCFEKIVPAVAYYSCLALPAAITQPGAHLLAEPFTAKAD